LTRSLPSWIGNEDKKLNNQTEINHEEHEGHEEKNFMLFMVEHLLTQKSRLNYKDDLTPET
jgi:hypothetical protein